MNKLFLIAIFLLINEPVYAECNSADNCIKEGGFGLGKVNGAVRAVYYELQETNELLKELIKEVRLNGVIHRKYSERG